MSTKKQFFKPLHNYSISLWTYLWNMLYIGLLFCTDFSYGIQSGRLMAPSSITTLSGDLHVQLQLYKAEDTPINNTILGSKNVQTNTLVISKFLQNKNGTQLKQVIENIPVFPDPRHNVTQITVPCETFSTAGSYELQFVTNLKMSTNENNVTKIVATTLMPLQDERLQQTLDVRWPRANIVLSKTRLNTYPETAVQVRLSFSDVACARAYQTSRIPEFWLELLYCGKDSSCFFISALNISKSNIFFAEQIRGFPAQHNITLNCELFGLAGIYAVQLRPMRPDLLMNFPLIRRLITVDWSDKFVFNVFARSIFPCDPHTGIGVLFEYPRCILDQGDRVRVYAKLRADVASLKPPTTLHYVAEQRVVKNQYSLHFSCDLFTEKYVEYCFVYVSQAISGAVADVRMDCVPTLPVAESDTGGWGPWSDWTPCSAKCLGGTRNRYRFCDSPPPRYGAKFCEGPSVETEKCEQNTDDTWDCIQDKSLSGIEIANKKKISQVIGPGCRCGCIVHVGSSKSKRMIAGALQSCPGKSFWLVQADHQKRLSMNFKFLRLPCASQYIRLRDGASLSSTLLHEIQGTEYVHLPEGIGSTGAQVLLETYAGDQITHFSNTQNATNSKLISHNPLNMYCNGGFTVEVEEIDTNKSLIGNTFLATSRQLFPTRDIKRIIRRSGLSIVHISVLTFASIIIFISTILGFQFIRRYQKYHLAMEKNCEDGLCLNPLPTDGSSNSLNLLPSRAVSTTTLISEVICFVKMRSKPSVRHSILRESVDAEYLNKDAQTNQLVNQHDKNDEEELNCEQQIAVEELSTAEAPELSSTASADTCSAVVAVPAGNPSRVFVVGVKPKRKSLQNKESQLRSESIDTCSINTPCNSPCTLSPTSMTSNECYDGVALKMLYSELRAKRQMAKLTSSKATSLDNAHLSPRKSVINIATIKPTNLKESKEQQNRRKLLSRPNSDMSLGQQDSEMEMDYYDYDVINAAAAPGSYFSMDPAHLVWIPPFEGHEIILESPTTPTTTNSSIEINKTETFFKENNKYGHFFFPTPSSDGSITPTNTNNTTTSTPTSLELLSLNKSNLLLKAVSPSEVHNFRNTLIQKTICADATLKGTRSLCNIASKMSETNTAELSSVKSVERDMMNESYTEKETSVVKSANDLQNYLALDDIKFADDSEPELENQTEVLRV